MQHNSDELKETEKQKQATLGAHFESLVEIVHSMLQPLEAPARASSSPLPSQPHKGVLPTSRTREQGGPITVQTLVRVTQIVPF